MSTFYVIRHKPSMSLLPARVLATHWDFTFPANIHEPRLFRTKRAALNCATCWAQGIWTRESRTESEGWEFQSYTYLAEPAPTTVAERKLEDLEVLPAELRL